MNRTPDTTIFFRTICEGEIQKRVAMADVFEMEKTQTKLKEKV